MGAVARPNLANEFDRSAIEQASCTIPTYSATMVAGTPASSATDIMTLTGSATRTIKILRWVVSGLATSAGAFDFLLIKRSTANAGANTGLTEVPWDSRDAAATATGRQYTANPTPGTAVGTVAAIKATLTTAAGGLVNVPTEYELVGPQHKPIVLRGTDEVLALNLNAVTITGGAITSFVVWTEE